MQCERDNNNREFSKCNLVCLYDYMFEQRENINNLITFCGYIISVSAVWNVYFMLLWYQISVGFFRWGTHLYMSLFPSVRPSQVFRIMISFDVLELIL